MADIYRLCDRKDPALRDQFQYGRLSTTVQTSAASCGEARGVWRQGRVLSTRGQRAGDEQG